MTNSQEPIKKPKKTINVSIQSKKYSAPINKILDKWEKNGLNASSEISENILLVDKLNKSITFNNMFYIYELIEKMVGLYEDLDSPSAFAKIENILSQVVSIDNSKLGSVLAQINEDYIKNFNGANNTVGNTMNNTNNINPTINNGAANNVNNTNVTDIPQRVSRQSASQNNIDDYNNQNMQVSQNTSSNYDSNTGSNVIEGGMSIPVNFLTND